VAYWAKALNGSDSDEQITTRLHGIDSVGNRLSSGIGYARGAYSITNPGNLEEITETLEPTESFTIPEDGRFAIEVLWSGNAAGNLEVHCNPPGEHPSMVTSPSADPGYPVPELPTIILLTIGLFMLGGYVWLRGRQEFCQGEA